MDNNELDYYDSDLDEYSAENSIALFQEKYFICDIPYNDIIERMTEQFIDYINTKDTMDYVSLFFNALYISYDNIDDDREQFPDECKEALQLLQSNFIDTLCHLFEQRIGIEFPDVDSYIDDKLVTVLHDVYEYFIINAKRNFKVAISEYLNETIKSSGDEYFRELQEKIESDFLTFIKLIKPDTFLQITGGHREIYSYYMNNLFVGNFLKKYTPALYKNYEFKIEIINYTTMVKLLKANSMPTDNI